MASEPRYLVTEKFCVDRLSETLVVDGTPVSIHNRTYQVLLLLMSRPNELVEKREIFETVWGSLDVSDAVLTTAVKELRQALGDDARNPWAIATVHARGYRLLLQVDERDEPIALRKSQHPAQLAWLAGIVLVAIVLALALVRALQPPDEASVGNSIAVLPFDDLSELGDKRWFADGLAEEILNSLAQSRDLLVAARTSSFRYGGQDTDIRTIGEALDVSHVLEGSVRQDASRLRVTAQLIRAMDGYHVWSRTYDMPVDTPNALSLQRNIAEDVMAMFHASVSTSHQSSKTSDIPLETYKRYLRGRQLVMERSPDAVLEGLDELSALVRNAPDFAPGHAWLAYAYLFSSQFSGRPVAESTLAAQVHVRRALELEPNGADSLTAAALLELFRSDVETAYDYANRAVAANPNFVPALRRRGVIRLMLGQPHGALEDFLAVQARDPLSAISLAHVADLYWIFNEKEKAITTASEAVRWNPNDGVARGTYGRILADAGQYLESLQQLEESVEANPNAAFSTQALAGTYWLVGLDDRIGFAGTEKVWSGLAAAALSAGDSDRALELLEIHGNSSSIPLESIELYHWHGDSELAYPSAMRLAVRNLLSENGLDDGYRQGTIPALLTLEASGDPQAAAIRENLARLFADKNPGDYHFGRDIYGAASWHMINGESQIALAWLDDALEKGIVFRALHLDPIWNPIRDSDAFREILTATDERMENIRAQYLAAGDGGATNTETR